MKKPSILKVRKIPDVIRASRTTKDIIKVLTANAEKTERLPTGR
jgi:hypothetical protein